MDMKGGRKEKVVGSTKYFAAHKKRESPEVSRV